jgi:type I restriction enzyme R subunit
VVFSSPSIDANPTGSDRLPLIDELNPAWKILRYHDFINVSGLDRHAVEEYPTANGPADYALFIKGQLLGIIEAKKVTVSPQNVLEQAKRYARGATNGPGQ